MNFNNNSKFTQRERSRSNDKTKSTATNDTSKPKERRQRVSKFSNGPSNFPPVPIISSTNQNPALMSNIQMPVMNINFKQPQNMQMPNSKWMPNSNMLLNQGMIPQLYCMNMQNPQQGNQNSVDNTKIKKKVYIPKTQGINYVGLLIGPKGTYQKRLEQQSGCKILVRGKGTQKEGMPPQPDDHEEQHVLIIGDSEDNVKRATHWVERILFADETTRTKIKEEQIKASQEIRTELLLKDGTIQGINNGDGTIKPIIENYLMTPYGPPDKNARILPVPSTSVGLIIGKSGDTIRKLNLESGCKIQIAWENVPGMDVRNVFIEGPNDKYEVAKQLIENIISEQIANKQNYAHIGVTNPTPGPHTPWKIPNKMVGLIIGKSGETLKIIQDSTGCSIFIPKESKPNEDFREWQLSGPPDSVELCKREIISMIHLAWYGRLPYMNSLFYPYIDPITRLPIIDPGIMAQLDPNMKNSEIQYNQNNNILIQKKAEVKEGQDKELNDKSVGKNDNLLNKQTIQSEPVFYNSSSFEDYESFEKTIFQNSKSSVEWHYDLSNYLNPLNYDLYYQSLYQMYPQMNDYYRKASSQDQLINNKHNQPLVLLNTSILEEGNNKDNNMLDNCMIADIWLGKTEIEEEKKREKMLQKHLKGINNAGTGNTNNSNINSGGKYNGNTNKKYNNNNNNRNYNAKNHYK